MFRIALIDDEWIVLKGIEQAVDWDAEELELVGMAEDGPAGYELIVNCRPDIVITDIRMPGMSGLDMIEKAKDYVSDTVYIIISGYNDFKYVQKAIGLGVIDYIEKPVTIEKLMAVLEKAREFCRYRKNYRRMSQKYQGGDRTKIARILLQLCFAKNAIPDLYDQLFHTDAAFKNVRQVCVGIIEQQPNEQGDIEQWRELFLELTSGASIEKDIDVFMVWQRERLVLFFICMEENGSWLVEQIKRSKEILCREGIQFWLGLGRLKDGIEHLQESFFEAESALKYACFLDSDRVMYIGEIEYSTHIPSSLAKGGKTLEYSVRTGDLTSVRHQIQLYLEELKKSEISPGLFCHECLEVIYLILKIADETDRSFVEETGFIPHLEIEKQRSFEEISSWTLEQTGNIMEWINAHKKAQGNRHIHFVRKYIDEHYAEELSLESLAALVRVTPAWLSVLFKEEEGTTYIKYLTSVRMEHAKKFLKEGMKAKEVCEAVGYYDYKHFSSVFKRYTQMTPDQYRKQ